MTLVSQCQSFCGEEDDPTKVTKVTVANSTHLRVSWHGLFTGCSKSDVEILIMLVVAEHSTDLSDPSKIITADFEAKEALVELNPCLGYKIYIRIFSNGGSEGRSFRDSKIIEYNDMSEQNITLFYGGMLKEFTNKICLKEEGVIMIPDPPEALSECILTKGDQANDEFTTPGQSYHIPLNILNPTNKEPLTITTEVNRIEACAPEPTTRILSNITSPTSPSNSAPMLGGVQSVIIFTASILVTTLVVALITAMVCWFKKKKRSGMRIPKIDKSTDYGVFFSTAGIDILNKQRDLQNCNHFCTG